jgi:hypothetical protein
VIPPAKTGNLKINKIVVKNKDQTYKEVRSNDNPFLRILEMVLIKLILPKIDLAPAKCKEKIIISTLKDECPKFLDKGG